MRNIELKAWLRDRTAALEACRALGARAQGDIQQADTYFRVAEGRLKLRVNVPGEAQLVFYRRADEPGPKGSDYTLVTVAPELRQQLAEALGVVAVVDKVRTLYLWENVRIHLDRVEGLGDFIEFEAVLTDGYDDADGHRKLARLQEAFEIRPNDLVPQSYVDLLSSCSS